ncbi:MAG: hypothetical protein KGZ49_07645, partial [Syntrophaceae bacterium]|nr:hypothetical protein [Syntrophaceae bacterium]
VLNPAGRCWINKYLCLPVTDVTAFWKTMKITGDPKKYLLVFWFNYQVVLEPASPQLTVSES